MIYNEIYLNLTSMEPAFVFKSDSRSVYTGEIDKIS
jgi:hypothetical protein